MAENLNLSGDRPSFSDAQSKLSEFTVDATWVNQDRYPRQVADINGDGRADIVGFAQDGVYVSLADGNGGFSAAKVGLPTQFSTDDTWVSQNRYPRQVADINGDGRADIVGFAQDGVYVALANGNGTFANATLALATQFSTGDTWVSQDRYPRQVADVNGDGRADIVGFAQDAVYVALANSNGTFANATIGLSNGFTADDGGWASQNQYPRQLADVNGDGRADIVGFGQNAVYVSLANSDGTFSDAIAGLTTSFTGDTTWVSQDRYPRQVADINGDGQADLIGFAQDAVYVSLSNGDGTFANATRGLSNGFTPDDGGWSSQNQYPRQVADINGDGQADLIGFGQNGVYVSQSTSSKDDFLRGGDGNDTLKGLTGMDTLVGELGNDTLEGGTDNDYLDGGAGNDTLVGGKGNDTLIGSSGYDIAAYSSQFTSYSTTFNSDGQIQITGSEGTDRLTSIERINFEVGFYNVYTGDQNNNTLTADPNVWSFLYGGNGNDNLVGGNGNDTLAGGNGNDTLTGGSGYDTAIYFGSFTTYNAEFTSDGAVQITGSEGTDLLSGIERINFGNGYYNVYTGDGNNNTLTADPNVWSLLYGGDGNDTLIGGNGNDTLAGGNDNDNLDGGSGNDSLLGGNGDDYLNGNFGNDSLDGGNGNDNIYGLLGNDLLNGGEGNDNLLGNNGDDRLVGGGGNDYLNGYGGTPEKDVLTGGSGADRFVLGERIVEQNNLGQTFYTQTGKNDYALITDWTPKSSSSDTPFDLIQLAGNPTQYKLNFAKISGIGGNAKDTEILFKLNNSWERIGIIQDSTKFNLSRDAVFI